MKESGGIFILAGCFLCSCATKSNLPPPELPAFVQPMFSNCKSTDGASGLRLFNGPEFLGSAELDFVVDSNSHWQLRLSDSMGPELLTVQSQKPGKGVLSTSGPMASRIPELSVLQNGFLEVDSRFSGIRANEIPCLASFRFPLEWTEHLKSVHRNGNKVEAFIDDGIREINLTFYRDMKEPNAEACARLQSSSWLSTFRAKWKLCIGLGSKPWATLDGFNGYLMKWNSYDQ